MRKPVQLGILVGPKGRGSNMKAIAHACRNGGISAEVRKVVAPVESAPALEVARDLGLATAVVPYGDEFGPGLQAAFEGCDILCLAGFLRILPSEVLEQFPNRVLNIHPALLPKFGGKGMYGMHVHEAVIAAGEKTSGCTVHVVSEHYDEGPILVQLECPVLEDDTPETLAARVLELEHKAYPLAIQRLIDEQ